MLARLLNIVPNRDVMQNAIAGNNSQIEKKPAVGCVLVVEDEALLRWALAETLAARGCHVLEAENAAEALSLVRRAPHGVDVVLLDLDLPDSAALTLLSAIRRLAPCVTVILMTAFGRDDIVRKALDLGTFRVVNKPFDIEDISDLVAQAFVAGHPPDALKYDRHADADRPRGRRWAEDIPTAH